MQTGSTGEGPDVIGGCFRLRSDWIETALKVDWVGVDARWADAAKGTLRRHGEPALCIEDVSTLALRACGVEPESSLRNPAWLSQVPQSDWAINSAWDDRQGPSGFSPGCLWSAIQDVRAVDDELSVASVLGAAGFELVTDVRRDGTPDWTMTHGPRTIHVEVKSKGGRGDAADLIYSALTSLQLLDGPGTMRQIWWEVAKGQPGLSLIASSRHRRMHRTISALFGSRATLAAALVQRKARDGRVTLATDGDLNLYAADYENLLEITAEFTDEPVASVTMWGHMDNDRNWLFHPHRSAAECVPARILDPDLELARRALDRLVLRTDAKQRGRQLKSFPTDTIWIVRWHAPFSWDDALADFPHDLEDVLRALTEESTQFRKGAAIGLWPNAFKRVGGRILLNTAAQVLLDLPYIDASRGRALGSTTSG